MKQAPTYSQFKRIASLCALAVAVASAFPCPSARADDDPFSLESAHWMSFDHYKDALKRGVVAQPPAEETPAAPPSDAGTQAAAPTSPTAVAAAPVIAKPMRPLDLPPMPGLNKGFKMQVTTTEDDTAPPTAPVISDVTTATAPTDIHISDKNWQDPASIVRYKKGVQSDDADAVPLDVRMSYLPDSKITPVPSPDHISAQHLARLAFEKNRVAKKPEKTPAEAAACAAIDAYKKQQLDAIQSDRQTLKALQDAISSLGLQKQLGFMTGNDSALNGGAQVNMDIPASTSVR